MFPVLRSENFPDPSRRCFSSTDIDEGSGEGAHLVVEKTVAGNIEIQAKTIPEEMEAADGSDRRAKPGDPRIRGKGCEVLLAYDVRCRLSHGFQIQRPALPMKIGPERREENVLGGDAIEIEFALGGEPRVKVLRHVLGEKDSDRRRKDRVESEVEAVGGWPLFEDHMGGLGQGVNTRVRSTSPMDTSPARPDSLQGSLEPFLDRLPAQLTLPASESGTVIGNPKSAFSRGRFQAEYVNPWGSEFKGEKASSGSPCPSGLAGSQCFLRRHLEGMLHSLRYLATVLLAM